MSSEVQFPQSETLAYLGLPATYSPAPHGDPILFLRMHLHQLPPHLQVHFSTLTTPKQRTLIPTIRNRRLKYTLSAPPELQFSVARNTWPELWVGRERPGVEEGREEKEWVGKGFLEGGRVHVGKLGNLLREYEEERGAQRVRELRRERMAATSGEEADFVPEEDTDSDQDEIPASTEVEESPEEARASFERLIRERFIYGLLEVGLNSSSATVLQIS
jgi:hypothetical protein